MQLASVILDIATQALDAPYSYAVESQMFEEFPVQVGCAVLVPFGNRRAIGFVVALRETSAAEDAAGQTSDGLKLSKIKSIVRALGKPYFNEIGARCAQFLADRYLAPMSSCIRLFVPPAAAPKIQRIGKSWEVTLPQVHEVDERWVRRLPEADNFTPRKNAAKQIAVMDALRQSDLRVSELTAEYGALSSTLKALENKGVIAVETRRRMRNPEAVSEAFAARVGARPELTADQQKAMDAIIAAQDAHDGHVVLVDGVTGSGKTEVYLCAIERALEAGQGAIVLVPEISLTPQTVARFRGRFGDTVAVLHSRMSQGERFDQWDLIRTGAARVVVGARSALFAPMANLGLVVIDEEHESSYKQDQAPRYVTRDVAEWLVRESGATLVLGSATPSLEALHRCKTDSRWQRVEMPNRANGRPMPPVQVVDMAREFGGGNRHMFSKALQAALFETIDAGQKAVLLLNQRGFAQFLLCRDCGYVPECESCSTSLTYHEYGSKLVCHHCGHTRAVPPVCPECGSPYLKRFGAGTQRVEDDLRSLLDGRECTIVRMDADTTARKGAHQRLLEQFASADAAVLLGTQMIAKGLDFDEVTLVGVINADTMLKLPDFRSSERTFSLIEQVAGRSGRGDLPGHVIVQTYSARDVAIQAAAHYDRQSFLDKELQLRRGLGYPPYVRMANILLWGKNEEAVHADAMQMFRDLCEQVARNAGPAAQEAGKDAWMVYPPCACVLSRLKGAYRYHILVKAPLDQDIAVVFKDYFRLRKVNPNVRVTIDIDPVSVL